MRTKDWKTKLIHSDAEVPQGFESLVTPVYRGSTVLFPRVAVASDQWNQHEVGYTYGLYGTPTTLELAAKICELENGFRTIITPGGQSAISLVHLALLKSGDHVLLPENIYGPNRMFSNQVLRRFGVEVSYYPPGAGAGISSEFKRNTRLIWCESPGSITMEVQDVPAIVAAAHQHGALVVSDNTWAAGVYFDAFAHGVDITIQALEFGVSQSNGSGRYDFSTQCDLVNTRIWRIWDPAAKHWAGTSAPCVQPPPNTWNHLTWEFERNSAGQAVFKAVTLNGTRSDVNMTMAHKSDTQSGIDVSVQLDANRTATPYSVWLDKVNLIYW